MKVVPSFFALASALVYRLVHPVNIKPAGKLVTSFAVTRRLQIQMEIFLRFQSIKKYAAAPLFMLMHTFSWGQVQLIKDINTNPTPVPAFTGNFFTRVGDRVFFPVTKFEGPKWAITDGTPSGTYFLNSAVNPFSGAGTAIEYQGKLFFSGSIGLEAGTELYCTDGTADGTKLVMDVFPGPGASAPSTFFIFQNKLYFTAQQPGSKALWRTDGTAVGTEMVVPNFMISGYGVGEHTLFFALLTGQKSSLYTYDGVNVSFVKDFTISGPPKNFLVLNDICYFSGYGDYSQGPLWRTDGTSAGTFVIDNVSAYNSTNLAFNNKLVFSNVLGIWATDGTPSTAVKLSSETISTTIIADNKLYVVGTSSLIRTDGTPGGTVTLGQVGSVDGNMAAAGSKVFMSYNPMGVDKTTQEAGIYDINQNSLNLLKDINPGLPGSQPNNWIALGDKVLFLADDGVHGMEVWVSDGTDAGTQLLMDTRPGTDDSNLRYLTVLNDEVYFTASFNKTFLGDVWKTKGDQATTVKVYSGQTILMGKIGSDLLYCDLLKLVKVNGTSSPEIVFDFTGNTNRVFVSGDLAVKFGNDKIVFWPPILTGPQITGREPWITDGTTAGTHILKDINPGSASSSFGSGAELGSKLLFNADDGTTGSELWVSDGTEAGTILLRDINPGTSSSNPSNFCRLGDYVYFSATTGAGTEFWKTDGTSSGTVMVKDIDPGAPSSSPTMFTVLGNRIYFVASKGSHPSALWASDGTEVGTTEFKFLQNGVSTRNSSSPKTVGDYLYFSGDDGVTGDELWVTDGTDAGTHVLDLTPGPESTFPMMFSDIGGILYFGTDTEIWKSAGTLSTTKPVATLSPNANQAVLFDKWVYVGATSLKSGEMYGRELYRIKHLAYQKIKFDKLADKKTGDADFSIGATSTSGLALTYSASPSGIIEISNGKIKILREGTVNITASQPGNDDFEPATPVAQTLSITKTEVKEETPQITTGLEPSESIFIHPNPASDRLQVSASGDKPLRIQILNLQGQFMLEQTAVAAETYVDVSGLAAGIYVVRVTSGDQVHLMKIVHR